MKHRPVLISKLAAEKAENERLKQLKLKELEKDKKISERLEKEQAIQEKKAIDKDVLNAKGRDSPKKQRGAFLDFLVRFFAVIANLISSIFDSLQWIIISAVLTVAVIIIFKYTGVDFSDVIDKVMELVNR